MKLGIVGTGNISSRHLDEFQKIENVKIEAVCDTNEKNLNKFINNNKINNTRGYSTLEEMLEKEEYFDGISNTTPDKFHKETTLKILEKGYNIFCEKPLAENYEDAKKMVEAAVSAEKINMVNFTYRESSAYQKLVEIIQSGDIGKPRHVSACYYQSWLASNKWGEWREEDKWLWRLSTQHGSNGALGDTGVHIFDFAVNAVGDIKEIFADLKTYHDKGEKIKDYILDANDGFNSLVRFENGAIGTVNATRFATGYKNRLELRIFGDKGAVKIEFDDAIAEGNKFMFTKDTQRQLSGKEDNLKWEEIQCEPSQTNFEKFIEAIKNNKNDEPDFYRGAEIQNILDKCFESSENGQWIDV